MLVLLYVCINSTNIPPIMIINRVYETDAVACFLPGRAKDLSAPLYKKTPHYNLQLLEKNTEHY